jgi:hypothetical protein
MLFEQDHSSSVVISLVVVHAVALLKSYKPDLDLELLRKEYPVKDDKERDTLIDSMFKTAQHFVHQYEFFVVDDQDSPDI